MKRPPRCYQHGLSLVELLLGLAITALVLAPLLPMLATASNAARITGDKTALEQEARFVLERVSARIRATAPSTQLPATTADWLKPAVYVFTAGTNGAKGTLVEQLSGDSHLLADSVTNFQLSAPPNTGGQPLIQVSLSLARGDASTTVGATVRMGSLP